METQKFIPLKFLNERLDKETKRQVALELGLFLECGGKLQETRDGEVVCSRCGLVWNDGGFQIGDQIPFNDEMDERGDYENHWHITSTLSFEKIGSPTLDRYKLYRVLAKSPNGRTDLGIRSRQIRVFSSAVDHPQVLKLLRLGSELCKKFGLDDRHAFANFLGHALRRIAILLLLDPKGFRAKQLAEATFASVSKSFIRDGRREARR